jgi:hypothetical protein
MTTFWTSTPTEDPKRAFRFRVNIGLFGLADEQTGDEFADSKKESSTVWYAKTIEKPKLAFRVSNENEASVGSAYHDARVLSWPTARPIRMTLIDPTQPNATRKLLRAARRAGYLDERASNNAGVGATHFDSVRYTEAIGPVWIDQLNDKGLVLERWLLHEPYITEIDFGNLDYSSDDLLEISITLGYKNFSVVQQSDIERQELLGNEQMIQAASIEGSTERSFEYYKDHDRTKFNQDERTSAILGIYQTQDSEDSENI